MSIFVILGGISMNEVTEKKKWFERVKMPHTYVILITILAIMTVLTHIIPAVSIREWKTRSAER